MNGDDRYRDRLSSLIGRFDRAMYGDLLKNFGPDGRPDDEYLAKVSGSSVEDIRGAHHNARNDSGIRGPKPDAYPR